MNLFHCTASDAGKLKTISTSSWHPLYMQIGNAHPTAIKKKKYHVYSTAEIAIWCKDQRGFFPSRLLIYSSLASQCGLNCSHLSHALRNMQPPGSSSYMVGLVNDSNCQFVKSLLTREENALQTHFSDTHEKIRINSEKKIIQSCLYNATKTNGLAFLFY